MITLKDNVAIARRYIAARILRDLGVSRIDELIVVVGPSSSPFSPKNEQRTRVRRGSRRHGKAKNGVNAFKTHSRVDCVPEHAHISPPSTSPNIFSRSKCRRISSPYFSARRFQREDFEMRLFLSSSRDVRKRPATERPRVKDSYEPVRASFTRNTYHHYSRSLRVPIMCFRERRVFLSDDLF